MSQRAMNFFYTTEWKEKCWFQMFFCEEKMCSSVPIWHYSGLYPPPFRLPYIKMCAKTNKEYTYKCTKAKYCFISVRGILDERSVYNPPVLFICFTARSTSPCCKIKMGSLEFIRNTFGKGMDMLFISDFMHYMPREFKLPGEDIELFNSL